VAFRMNPARSSSKKVEGGVDQIAADD